LTGTPKPLFKKLKPFGSAGFLSFSLKPRDGMPSPYSPGSENKYARNWLFPPQRLY
jgi:hypothetical protein